MKRQFVAILICAAVIPAWTYVLKFDASGVARRWNFAAPNASVPTNSFNRTTHAIRYWIASDAYSTTNTAAEINAVRASFGQWQSIPNTMIKFEEAGLAIPGFQINTSDGFNVVEWARNNNILVNGSMDNISGQVGVTYTRSFVSDNTMAEFDIVLNGAENSWFTDFNDTDNPSQFVESTAIHEIGHALGASHATVGGATMLYAGSSGVDAGAGLSQDEVSFARALYPASNILSTLGKVTGTVTKGGVPVVGAAVIIEGTNGNLAGGTITRSNGIYSMTAIPPGAYNVRVWPLDPAGAVDFLINGASVNNEFAGADTSFLPRPNAPVTLTAGGTNTLNLSVTNGSPAFRITWLQIPTTDPTSVQIIPLPVTLSPGQTRYVGVLSSNLPTSGASLTITGDGLTIDPPEFYPALDFGDGLILNGILTSVTVATNATPGLRTFVVTKNANNAYANGFIEILPTIPDYNFDGLDDRFQRKYFSPFTKTNAAPKADPDGDKFDNYAEYLSGTNPTNASSFLKIQSITTTAGGTTISWQSDVGKRFQVMSRTNATLGSWTNVGAVVTAAGTNVQFLDVSATNGIHLYRIQALP